MKVFEKALIFSVFNETNNYVNNVDNHVRVLDVLKLNSIPYVELTGSYNGKLERSFLITNVKTHRPIVEKLCSEYKQDCYLELDIDRHAELVFPNGDRQSKGYLVSVSETEARSSGNYVYSPVVNQYYITKE